MAFRMKKLTSLLLAAALGAGVLSGQTSSTDPVIIAAGDLSIRRSEFEAAMRSLPAQYQEYALGPGKRQFAEDFLRMKLLASAGKKQGLDRDAEVLAQLDMMRDNLVAAAMLQRIEGEAKISEEALRAAYEARKNEMETAEARHILVAFAGSPAAQPGKPELTEEQAKAKAEELRRQLDGGASFDELAKAESDDVGSGAQGGALGRFGRGQMVPEFEQAVFTTEVGKLSDIVRTQFGYHIVRVDARSTMTFEEVREQLEAAERRTAVQAEIEKLRSAVTPSFDETYFGS
jgi:peptidyl-prolyl cis-trans isomerase C